jgi:hypothetical protein
MNDSMSDRNTPLESSVDGEKEGQTSAELPEVEQTSFLDKVIAFGVLVFPFSWVLVSIRDQLESHVSKSVNNIVFLTGIVAFLLVVGKVAERVRDYRKAHRHS